MFQRRRHVLIAIGLLIASVAACFGFVLVKSMSSRWLNRNEDLVNAIGVTVFLSLGLAFILWTCWGVPYCGALHLLEKEGVIPRSRVGPAKRLTRLPALIFIGMSVMILFVERNPFASGFRWDTKSITALVLFAVGLVLLVIGLIVANATAERIKQTALQCKRCFDCGYDLRGSESGNCPECGLTMKE